MLKFFVKSLDEVEEQYRGLYKESGEGATAGFTLQVEGAVPKAKLDEFRDNNTTLLNERDDLRDKLKKFGDLDPDKAKAAIEKAAEYDRKVQSKELVDDKGVEAAIEKGIADYRKKVDDEIEGLKKKVSDTERQRDDLKGEVQRRDIEGVIMEAARRENVGVLPTAIPDILRRARDEWVRDEESGRPVVKRDGRIVRGGEGIEPMTAAEWIEELRGSSPHYFAGNKGGGAGGDGGDGGPGEFNPWNPKTFNLTEQGKLRKSDPDRAKKLAAKYGHTL